MRCTRMRHSYTPLVRGVSYAAPLPPQLYLCCCHSLRSRHSPRPCDAMESEPRVPSSEGCGRKEVAVETAPGIRA
eukprot:2470794-Pleurochrysis_carterae.AAC.1